MNQRELSKIGDIERKLDKAINFTRNVGLYCDDNHLKLMENLLDMHHDIERLYPQVKEEKQYDQ